MNMQQRIESSLEALQADYLAVLDESHLHSRGLETHYKVVAVSAQFAGLNAVRRHQRVYAVLGELMGQIHALALHTFTAEEWAEQAQVPASPTCRGGSKHDQVAS
jgi:BolA protein